MQTFRTLEKNSFQLLPKQPGLWVQKEADFAQYIQVKEGLRHTRDLRSVFFELGSLVAHFPKATAQLLLVLPSITSRRLFAEWKELQSIFKEEIISRMGYILLHKEKLHTVGTSESFEQVIKDLQQQTKLQDGKTYRFEKQLPKIRKDPFFTILKILVNRWLLKEGSCSVTNLMGIAGFSYPTVSKALKKMEKYLHQNTNKSVELKEFPLEFWNFLLSAQEKIRHTLYFSDGSGKPRTPEFLFKKINQLNPSNMAIAGSFGAHYWYPAIDLHGNPRLDISVHVQKEGSPNLDFIKRLDPALVPVREQSSSVSLAIHVVSRNASLFTEGTFPVPWADPVECLLDLQSMRLDAQAYDFIEFLRREVV